MKYNPTPITKIICHWHENEDDSNFIEDDTIFTSFRDFNEAVRNVYDHDPSNLKNDGTYHKYKFSLIADVDKVVYSGRLYVCEKEANPFITDNVILQHLINEWQNTDSQYLLVCYRFYD